MYPEMTRMSGLFLEAAKGKNMTIQEAIHFLDQKLETRSLRSILEKYAKGRDLRTILVRGLLENHKDAKRDSIERRVRGWLNEKSEHSIWKRDAIEIAYILDLSFQEADEFVTLISGEKLHWRSVDEVVYIYGLRNGLSFAEVTSLQEELQDILQKGRTVRKETDNSVTKMIRSEVSLITTPEELKDYLIDNVSRFGIYHNYAYRLFMRMLARLESPVDEMEASLFLEERDRGKSRFNESLTIRDILKEYLYQDSVLRAKQKAVNSKKELKKKNISEKEQYILNRIQRDIVESWPDETMLSKIKSRKADVTRKTLILLFLATDSGSEDEEYEVVFEDMYRRLNRMLDDCGFSRIDPRNPFDWLILYCLCAEDLLDVDQRMHEMMETMFGKPWLLEVVRGVLSGTRIEIEHTVNVGRNQEKCHLVYPVSTPGISGCHCSFSLKEGKLYLTDIGSKYGTFLNRRKLTAHVPIQVRRGDMIALASEHEVLKVLD